MHAETHALADLHLLRRNFLNPTHQAEALIAVDQRNVEGLTLGRMHDRRGVHRSKPLTDAPFEPIAAGKGTKQARIEDDSSRFGAELIGQLAALEVVYVCLEWR